MSLRYDVIVFGRFTNQRDGSFGLLWTNPDVDVLSFESFFVSLHFLNCFGGSYYFFFQNYQKFRSNIFFIMNNTQGNAQRQGAEPRRASTLNAISNPKPHFHCKHSNFWLQLCLMPDILVVTLSLKCGFLYYMESFRINSGVILFG